MGSRKCNEGAGWFVRVGSPYTGTYGLVMFIAVAGKPGRSNFKEFFGVNRRSYVETCLDLDDIPDWKSISDCCKARLQEKVIIHCI